MNRYNPIVSIVTIVYNGEKYLERTIKSVLAQTYNNIEYIIIDGGSTDSSIDIIKKYENQISYWHSETDEGISDAFNKGIKRSSGEIIGLLNADDWYEPDAVSLAVSSLRNPDAGLALGFLKKFTLHGSYVSYPENLYSNKFKYKALIFNHPSCFVKKEIYSSFGMYRQDLRYAMDYDFILRIIIHGVKYNVVKSVIVNMQDGGMSESHIISTIKEVSQISITHGANKIYVYPLLYYKLLVSKLRLLLKLPKIGVLLRNRKLRANET
jgi:glycosyltransferase involved in cell wall biosynthesis